MNFSLFISVSRRPIKGYLEKSCVTSVTLNKKTQKKRQPKVLKPKVAAFY
jgi:hypothetical protein